MISESKRLALKNPCSYTVPAAFAQEPSITTWCSKTREALRLQEQVRSKENAVQAIRDGSKAEISMAAAACKEAELRAGRAEEALAQVTAELRQAEERVETALQESRRKQEAAQKRCVKCTKHSLWQFKPSCAR